MPKVLTEQEVGARIEEMRRRPQRFRDDRITMAHGAGGKASRALVEGLVVPTLGDHAPSTLSDAAELKIDATALAFTTDSFVVRPLTFPGGTIGELAVNGTVNDLAVSGARPLALSLAMILEEGLSAEALQEQVRAVAAAAAAAGVPVATGDTKVVERGKCDAMFLTTAGIGVRRPDAHLAPEHVRPGDKVLVSGTIGDHGVAIMLARGNLDLQAEVRSDTRSLWPVAQALLDAVGTAAHCLRDATRGGVATVLNEIAAACDLGVLVAEDRLPVRPEVTGACEILGIDPLYVANEGKLVAFVAPEAADAALEAMRRTEAGAEAAMIGEVRTEPPGRVLGRTGFGGHRIIDVLVGDPLPRIC